MGYSRVRSRARDVRGPASAMRTMRRLLLHLDTFNALHTRWAQQAAGVLLAVMLTVVMSQVVFRYALGSSLSWSEEVSKSLMVWTVFFVAPWAYRNGANVSIGVLQDGFSARFRAVVQLLLNVIVFWVLARLFWESLFFVERGWSISASSVPIKMGWVYLVTPVSLVAMMLVGVELMLRQLFELAGHEPPGALDADKGA